MKEGFILYHSLYHAVRTLADNEKGQLFDAIFQYQLGETIRDLNPMCQMAFRFIETQFERDNEKYKAVVERNRINGSKGRKQKENPDDASRVQSDFVVSNGSRNSQKAPKNLDAADTDTVTDTDLKEKGKKKSERFSPPSVDEFTNYFVINGFSFDIAKRAYNGYEVAEWHDSSGKPIKNWKQKCQHVWFKPENKQESIPQLKQPELIDWP